MALLSNGHRLGCNPMRVMGGPGTATTLTSQDRAMWGQKGALNNLYAGEATVIAGASIANKNAMPVGALHPGSWVLPIKAGGLSSRRAIVGAGSFVGSIAGGRNGEASLLGAGSFSGTGALIVSLVASISGAGDLTGAELKAFLNLAASLSGVGGVSAQASALAHLVATLEGEGVVNATIRALGALASSITVSGDLLTTTNVASAVWSALAATNNVAGTMGAKLNAAASSGDPWSAILPGAYVAGEAGHILGNLADTLLDASGAVDGLTPRQALTLMLAALANKLSGAGTSTVTIRDVADTKDRIVATVDSNGNRTTVTLDGD